MSTEHTSPPYQLRPATLPDTEFLWKLRQSVMRENVEQTWGTWDDSEQRKFFARGFLPKNSQIILVANKAAGRLDLNRSNLEIFLASIELLPELQGKGIGSAVIRGLMDEARTAQLPLRLQVLKANPRAHQLYQRLGFTSLGETTTHFLMVYSPPE